MCEVKERCDRRSGRRGKRPDRSRRTKGTHQCQGGGREVGAKTGCEYLQFSHTWLVDLQPQASFHLPCPDSWFSSLIINNCISRPWFRTPTGSSLFPHRVFRSVFASRRVRMCPSPRLLFRTSFRTPPRTILTHASTLLLFSSTHSATYTASSHPT